MNLDDIEMQDNRIIIRAEEPPSVIEKKCRPYARMRQYIKTWNYELDEIEAQESFMNN